MNAQMLENAAERVSQQTQHAVGFLQLCQDHTEKFADLWTAQTVDALQEGQKLMKEWWSTGNQVVRDTAKVWETNLKKTAEVLVLQKEDT